MKILSFESSCDETAVAVVEDGRKILSDAIASQADLHALYGGVVPEIASRKHIEAIAALTDQALKEAGVEKKDIDAVAATYAPGLIGAVLVGLNFAKSAAYALNVPLIPVHHIRGHIAANYLAFPELEPPFLALCMSGGNTLIVDVRDYTDFALLGATRDDAAGECFDKAARVLGLPYPGGAAMDKLAHESEGGVYELPRAKIDGCPLDMSFSGLKTAVVNLAHNAEQTGKQLDRAALARDFTQAVVDELVPRAMLAMQQSGRKVLVAAGGVAANSFIRAELEKECRKHGYRLYMPPLKLCGDNGAVCHIITGNICISGSACIIWYCGISSSSSVCTIIYAVARVIHHVFILCSSILHVILINGVLICIILNLIRCIVIVISTGCKHT